MAKLLSVNVGLPRDIEWSGRVVRTGIWKDPVHGRCRVGRLNLDGDGQGDLAGHGGEQRAVFVYQIESYGHWEQQLRRSDFVYGQFGENFTVEGMTDDQVCIGDRYEVGTALFEVTQPRVTCYRVGIRMNEPRMPALLTSSGRPGFYFRVLREGEVRAGDAIVKVGEAKEQMTVAEINALLYLPNHDRKQLERALRVEALSPGWRSSFDALLRSRAAGNAGLVPESASHPTAPGFRRVVVAMIDQESADVISLTMRSADGEPMPMAIPGQYVVVRMHASAGGAPLVRSYSLSGPVSTQSLRISVKVEANGAAGAYLRDHVRVGDALDVSSPHGSFLLLPGDRPVVLLSAGIGATPVLAMLHQLAAERSTRPVVWLHAARDGSHHPFSSEVSNLLHALAHGRRYVCFSKPDTRDRVGEGFDAIGHLSETVFEEIGLPRAADIYLCGPNQFMAEMQATLIARGVPSEHIHIEIFSGGESLTPGVVGASPRAPHLPANDTNACALVSFARSGIAAHWSGSAYRSILELAEACDVPVRWSCRAGVCHNCESGLISGPVVYEPEPLERPVDGNVLVCCSQPTGDVVVDL